MTKAHARILVAAILVVGLWRVLFSFLPVAQQMSLALVVMVGIVAGVDQNLGHTRLMGVILGSDSGSRSFFRRRVALTLFAGLAVLVLATPRLLDGWGYNKAVFGIEAAIAFAVLFTAVRWARRP